MREGISKEFPNLSKFLRGCALLVRLLKFAAHSPTTEKSPPPPWHPPKQLFAIIIGGPLTELSNGVGCDQLAAEALAPGASPRDQYIKTRHR